MMKTEFRIKQGSKEFPINVQVLRDNIYCGIGRFCRNNREAGKYINSFGRV